MLHNVGHTGTVVRGCSEPNVKHLVIVIVGYIDEAGPGFIMLKNPGNAVYFFNIFLPQKGESM